MASVATQVLCRVLAEDALPPGLDPARLDEIWEHATWTSVDELLAAILCRPGTDIPAAARDRAISRLRDATARELARHRELRRLIDCCKAAGVRTLLIKGAGLAYTIYSDPRLRPGDDIDLFIARESLDTTESALQQAGYRRQVEPDSDLASMQRHYARAEPGGQEHCVDLHWRVANRQVFAGVLDFEAAWTASIPVLPLGLSARTLGVPDALLLACVHRVAHHPGHVGLLWLWDVHLLAGRLTSATADALVQHADRAGVRAVLASGLDLSRRLFGTAIEQRLLDDLTSPGRHEPSARFLGTSFSQIELLRSDVAAAGSLTSRLRLLREHLFPGREYMRAKYAHWPPALLPFAYVHRIARGAPKWLRRPAVTAPPR